MPDILVTNVRLGGTSVSFSTSISLFLELFVSLTCMLPLQILHLNTMLDLHLCHTSIPESWSCLEFWHFLTSKPILSSIYRCAVESSLVLYIIVWYASCEAAEERGNAKGG